MILDMRRPDANNQVGDFVEPQVVSHLTISTGILYRYLWRIVLQIIGPCYRHREYAPSLYVIAHRLLTFGFQMIDLSYATADL